MKARILYLTILAALFTVACNDDDDINISSGGVTLTLPATIKNAASQLTATIKNINTGAEIEKKLNKLSLSNLDLEEGVYNIIVRGTATYPTSYVLKHKDTEGKITEEIVTKEITSEVRGAKENIEVKGSSFSVAIPLFLASKSKSFVISEIFFSYTKTPKDKGEKIYFFDQFIELYNNTDHVLYADGLCIGETKIQTTHINENLTPDIRNEAVPLRTVYRIPGSGKEHPVQPGETFVFCDVARNHTIENPNSVDLSKANFEWYDDNKRDVDTPEAPNMERIVKESSKSVFKLHSLGRHSYVLFHLDNSISAEEFAKSQAFQYQFTLKEKTYTRNVWKIQNDKIIDAVECSTPSGFKWKALSPELDITWTHSGDADDKRYGHSVKRKISHKDGNRIVLQDTNDSASDFIATAPNPSPGKVIDHK